MADDASTPRGGMGVEYDRSAEPVTIGLLLDQDGFGLEQFGYRFEGYSDRSGTFTYAFRNDRGDLFLVTAGFDGAGQGRAAVGFRTAGGFSGGFRELGRRRVPRLRGRPRRVQLRRRHALLARRRRGVSGGPVAAVLTGQSRSETVR